MFALATLSLFYSFFFVVVVVVAFFLGAGGGGGGGVICTVTTGSKMVEAVENKQTNSFAKEREFCRKGETEYLRDTVCTLCLLRKH